LKKTFIILVFGILTNNLIGQEISSEKEVLSEYMFKKETRKPNKLKWNEIELDSLVLYNNGAFNRTYAYEFHQIIYSEFKGSWKIQNDTLNLKIKYRKLGKANKTWNEFNSHFMYKIKRTKLVPIYNYNIDDFFELNINELYTTRKLKLIKK